MGKKKIIPYEEQKFLMEFLDLWKRYGNPPIKLHTDNLVSNDNGSGGIHGSERYFIVEALDLAEKYDVNVQLECLGVSGIHGDTPVMEAGDDEDDDDTDTVTDYGDEDDEEEEPTDYGGDDEPAEDAGGDDPEATDGDGEEGAPEGQSGEGEDTTDIDGRQEDGEASPTEVKGGTEDDGTGDDAAGGENESDEVATDYGEEAGAGGDATGGDDTSEDTTSDEQSDSSNTNILIKNFSLMRDFEKLYSLITDNANTLNSTLKADPGQNRVLVQVSRNLTSIKDFILSFIQFHFKNDNYQYNLYYYEVAVHLLKLNLNMLEKALKLGSSKDNKKEVNKNG